MNLYQGGHLHTVTVVDLQDTDGLVEAAGGWSELGGKPCISQLPQRGPGQRRLSQDDAEPEWWAHARSHTLHGYLSQAARRQAKDRPDLKVNLGQLGIFFVLNSDFEVEKSPVYNPRCLQLIFFLDFFYKTQFILSQILKPLHT